MKQTHDNCPAGDVNCPTASLPEATAAVDEMAGARTALRPEASAPCSAAPELKSGGDRPLDLPSHDELAQLARNDPQAFENLRSELIASFIEHAPPRHKTRLSGIQFRVDCERRLSRSPLGSTVRVYKLMWESFLSLNGNWQALVRAKEEFESPADAAPAPLCEPLPSARILDFRPPRAREPD